MLHERFEKFVNDVPERTSPLVKAALAHVQFETLHPFLDGNGRLGRLLIPLVFLQEKLLSEPLLYLSLYFKTHRDDYYRELQRVREEGDWERWIAFFADAVSSTATQSTQTIRALHELSASDAVRTQALGRVGGSAARVLGAFSGRPVGTAASLQLQTGLSAPTVNKALSALQNDLGIVHEITGSKRGRVFVYTRYLEILNG